MLGNDGASKHDYTHICGYIPHAEFLLGRYTIIDTALVEINKSIHLFLHDNVDVLAELEDAAIHSNADTDTLGYYHWYVTDDERAQIQELKHAKYVLDRKEAVRLTVMRSKLRAILESKLDEHESDELRIPRHQGTKASRYQGIKALWKKQCTILLPLINAYN